MQTDRRGFLKFLGLGVAGIALEEAIPFNRVWSFPKQIVVAPESCDWVRVTETWMRFRCPERYVVTRQIGDFLYEVEPATKPIAAPFRVIDSYVATGEQLGIDLPKPTAGRAEPLLLYRLPRFS